MRAAGDPRRVWRVVDNFKTIPGDRLGPSRHPGNQRYSEENEKDKKQNFRDPCCGRCNSEETEYGSDKRNDEKR